MLSKSMLRESIEAVYAYGSNAKPSPNKLIKEIVDLFDQDYNSVKECMDRYDVTKHNFKDHDLLIEQAGKDLGKILKSCKTTWEGEVKPTAKELIDSINKYIDIDKNGRVLNEHVDGLSVNKIINDPAFEKLLNGDYLTIRLENSLSYLSNGIEEEPKSADEISRMIVESKIAIPENLITYLAELPTDLIQDTYNEVFINKNKNGFLPIDFKVTGDDYFCNPVYGKQNLDKLFLTIMIANYLKDNPGEHIQVSLDNYTNYYNTLFNIVSTVASSWVHTLLSYIRNGIVSPKRYSDSNGEKHIAVNTDLLEKLPSDITVIELIIGLSNIKQDGIVLVEDFNDEDLVKRATKHIEMIVNDQITYIKNKTNYIVDTIFEKYATVNGYEYTTEIAREVINENEIFKKVLKFLCLIKYNETYIEELIRIYIESDESNPSMDIEERNGIAFTRLAAYIVTH